MPMSQDDIPEGLRRFVEMTPKRSTVSVPLTDEVLNAAVASARPMELVSADDRIVSFVDLLGTRSLMKQVEDQSQAQGTYDKFTSIGILFEKCAKECQENVDGTKYVIISDSYVISVPNKPGAFDALISSIVKFQRDCLLKFKELVRGGVAVGKMVVGENVDMMIGKALVEAHGLEKDIASYPRVVINCDININEMSHSAPISHDKDGMYYVSFLSGLDKKELDKARSIIVDKKKDQRLHERQKLEWVQTYIDQVMNKNECCCVCKKEV